ncbi:hypothetical protein ACTWPB_07730 [Nocardia sp. IBHARD005]|uniref:hypothetical protein n=1 Tax=Nocardia sp. IBHARD005 TaxID=3457765 RepID=UPI0040581340
MTALESEVLEALTPTTRLLRPETLAAILQRPRAEIDKASKALRAQGLVGRNASGQWYAYREQRVS